MTDTIGFEGADDMSQSESDEFVKNQKPDDFFRMSFGNKRLAFECI